MNYDPSLWSSSRIYRRPYDPERNNADWNAQEDEDLVRGFLRGDSLADLAKRHMRKVNAIETRLNTGRAAATCEGLKKYPKEVIKPPHRCHFKPLGLVVGRIYVKYEYECEGCGSTILMRRR